MSDPELRYRPPAADVAIARERPWPRLAWAIATLGVLGAGWRLLEVLAQFFFGFVQGSSELREIYLEYMAPSAAVGLAIVVALASAIVLLLRRKNTCLLAWVLAALVASIQLTTELDPLVPWSSWQVVSHASVLLPSFLGLFYSLWLSRRGSLS